MLRKLRRLIAPTTVPAPEQRHVELAGQPIPYTLKRSARRRTVGLRIDQRGLTVNVPLRASQKWLHEVLLDKADWIVGRLRDWQERQPQRWADGEAVLFRGEVLTLQVTVGGRMAVAVEGEVLRVKVADPADPAAIERAVTAWYKRQARQLFDASVACHAGRMGVMPKEVRLTSARTRWGSCTAHGVIRLNWRLIRLPVALVDYVVVHELAHLREMNHSPAFWAVVSQHCPDHAERRRLLRSHALGNAADA